MLANPTLTGEWFDEFAQQEENSDKILEWIQGEVFEVPSNILVSQIAMIIGKLLGNYLDQNPIGYVTGEGALSPLAL